MRYLEKKGERVKWLVSLMSLAILMTITNCGGRPKKGNGNSNPGDDSRKSDEKLALEIQNGRPKLVNKGEEAIDLGQYSFTAKVIEAKDHDGNNIPNLKAKLIKGGLSVSIEGTMTASTVAGGNSTFNPGQAIDFGIHPDSYEGVATAKMECCLLKEGKEVGKQQVEWRSKVKITLGITGGDSGADFILKMQVKNVTLETVDLVNLNLCAEVYEGEVMKSSTEYTLNGTIPANGQIGLPDNTITQTDLKNTLKITNKFSMVFIIKDATGQVVGASKRQERQLTS